LPALGSEPEEIPMRPAPVKIDAGGSPLAFGNLLGSAVVKEEEEELGFIPTVHPIAAPDRDWRSAKDEEPEEEAEEGPKHSWRRDAAEEAFGGADKSESKVSDWRESGPAAIPNARPHLAEWTPTKEKTDFVEAEDAPETVPAGMVDKVLSEVRASSQAAPFAGDAWAAAIAAGSEEKTAVATADKPADPFAETAHGAAVQEIPGQVPAHEPVPVPASGATEAVATGVKQPSLTNSWFQTVSSPWEAEAQKANQLASTWDAPVVAAATAVTEIAVAHAAAPEAGATEAVVLKEEALVTTGVAEHAGEENPSAYVAEGQILEVASLHGEDPAVVAEHEAGGAKVETVDETAASAPVVEAARDPEFVPTGTVEAVAEAGAAHPAPHAESILEQVTLSSAAVEAIREEAAQVTEAVQHETAAPATEASVAAASAPEPSMDDLVAKVLAKVSPEVLQAVTRDILKSVVEGIVRDELNSKKP